MKKSSIIGNSSWIIASKIIQSLLGLVITMFTARYLGPSNYGLINYAASIVSFISPVALLGADAVLVQEIVSGQYKEEEILGSAIGASLFSSVFCIIGVSAFSIVSSPHEHSTIIVCLIYSTILIFQSLGLIQYWFQAKLLSKYASVAMILAYIVTSAYKVVILVTNKNVFWFAFSNVLDAALIAIILIFTFTKLTHGKLRYSNRIAKKIVKRSKYYIFANLMISVCAQTDKIMLKVFVGDEATGLYSAAVSCATMTGFIFSAIIDSFRPAIFESHSKSKEAFELDLKRLFSVVIYLSIIQSLFICVFSKFIILLLYGRDYINASSVLGLIVWYTTFAYVGSVRGIWMLAENLQKYVVLISAIAAGGNVLLNVVLIPTLGIQGAALASLLSQIIANILVPLLIGCFNESNKLLLDSLQPKYIVYMIKIIKERMVKKNHD